MKMEIQFKQIPSFPPTRSLRLSPPGRHDDEGTSLLFSSGPEAAISGFKDLRNRYAAELKGLLPLHVFVNYAPNPFFSVMWVKQQ